MELADVLEEINELLDQGIITADDFRDLLSRGRKAVAAQPTKRTGNSSTASRTWAVTGKTQAPALARHHSSQHGEQRRQSGMGKERKGRPGHAEEKSRTGRAEEKAAAIREAEAAAQREVKAAEIAASEAAERAWMEKRRADEWEDMVPMGVPWGEEEEKRRKEAEATAWGAVQRDEEELGWADDPSARQQGAAALAGGELSADDKSKRAEEWEAMRRVVVGDGWWRTGWAQEEGQLTGEQSGLGAEEREAAAREAARKEAEEAEAWTKAEQTLAQREEVMAAEAAVMREEETVREAAALDSLQVILLSITYTDLIRHSLTHPDHIGGPALSPADSSSLSHAKHPSLRGF